MSLWIYSRQVLLCSFLAVSSLPANQIIIKSSFAQQLQVSPGLKRKEEAVRYNENLYYIVQYIEMEATSTHV